MLATSCPACLAGTRVGSLQASLVAERNSGTFTMEVVLPVPPSWTFGGGGYTVMVCYALIE